jgi:hypothetical protein
MNITFGGGLFGPEALAYQGRKIVEQLEKLGHKINLDCPEVDGYWSRFFNNFKPEEEDLYILNGHYPRLPELAKIHKKIIDIAVFETTLPREWVDALNIPEVVQIWTVSEFSKELLVKSGVQKPIFVIYLGIDERFKKNGVNLFPKDKSFKFLSVSAPHGVGKKDRKGLDVLVKAFKEEFGDSEEVLLILKINTIYADQLARAKGMPFSADAYVRELIPTGMKPNNIVIFTDYMGTEILNNLYNSVDCGVYPSRSEGFGLPQAEMALIGKPVITTNYSATTEFSDPELMVEITGMEPLDYNQFPYFDSLFGEPSVESLRKMMRKVLSEKTPGKLIEAERFTWEAVGQRIEKLLNGLNTVHS